MASLPLEEAPGLPGLVDLHSEKLLPWCDDHDKILGRVRSLANARFERLHHVDTDSYNCITGRMACSLGTKWRDRWYEQLEKLPLSQKIEIAAALLATERVEQDRLSAVIMREIAAMESPADRTWLLVSVAAANARPSFFLAEAHRESHQIENATVRAWCQVLIANSLEGGQRQGLLDESLKSARETEDWGDRAGLVLLVAEGGVGEPSLAALNEGRFAAEQAFQSGAWDLERRVEYLVRLAALWQVAQNGEIVNEACAAVESVPGSIPPAHAPPGANIALEPGSPVFRYPETRFDQLDLAMAESLPAGTAPPVIRRVLALAARIENPEKHTRAFTRLAALLPGPERGAILDEAAATWTRNSRPSGSFGRFGRSGLQSPESTSLAMIASLAEGPARRPLLVLALDAARAQTADARLLSYADLIRLCGPEDLYLPKISRDVSKVMERWFFRYVTYEFSTRIPENFSGLLSLANALPPNLARQILLWIIANGDVSEMQDTLADSVARWREMFPQESTGALRSILRALSGRKRPDVYRAIEVLLPILERDPIENSLADIAQVVIDNGCWWE